MKLAPLAFRSATWNWERPYIAGVVNVTPDSFSDGGRYRLASDAAEHARALAAAGADLIDIGGESTRPGASAVSADQELDRVLPVLEALKGLEVPISIDTTKAEVARSCVEAGAEVINDVSGGQFDPGIWGASLGASAYVCGHVRGASIAEVHRRESESPGFEEVCSELSQRLAMLPAELRCKTIADPCLGFGKRAAQNLELCNRAGELRDRLQCAVMIGASRKRFVAELSGHEAPVSLAVRDSATVGASLAAVAGGAQIVRVHNVDVLAPALRLFNQVRGALG